VWYVVNMDKIILGIIVLVWILSYFVKFKTYPISKIWLEVIFWVGCIYLFLFGSTGLLTRDWVIKWL